jgi:hypothetical protein
MKFKHNPRDIDKPLIEEEEFLFAPIYLILGILIILFILFLIEVLL